MFGFPSRDVITWSVPSGVRYVNTAAAAATASALWDWHGIMVSIIQACIDVQTAGVLYGIHCNLHT